jgi:polysaccharide deacetylase
MKHPLDLTVMMYHYVRDPGDSAEAGSGIPGMSVKDFESQLDELAQKHAFISWLDVRAALQEEKSLPASPCLLTFDDGVRDHYVNVFRILRERNLSGLFFALDRRETDGLVLAHKIHFLLVKLGLNGLRETIWKQLNSAQRERFTEAEKGYSLKYPPISDEGRINLLKAVLQRDLSNEVDPLLGNLFETYVGSQKETAQDYYLNLEQMREMTEGGMHFAGHSHSHPWFDWIDAEARTAEIKASAEFLQKIESGPWAFAFPYGGLAEDAPQKLKAHGFIAAFTTKPQLQHTDPFLIGRLDGEEVAQNGHSYA